MELAMRVATSASTGTPAAVAMALISFAAGVVMRPLCPLLVRGYGLNPQSPCRTPIARETRGALFRQ
jgi:hypothetical protein